MWSSIDWALLCFSVLCLIGLITYLRRKTAELAQVNLDYLDTRVQERKHMKEFTEEGECPLDWLVGVFIALASPSHFFQASSSSPHNVLLSLLGPHLVLCLTTHALCTYTLHAQLYCSQTRAEKLQR